MEFKEVLNINVNDKVENKGGLTYLSWAWAWAEFKKIYPQAKYEVKKFDNKPYLEDANLGYMVFTQVEVDDLKYEMWLPVMDFRNKAIAVGQATMFDINKTIMRCLTKNLAMFGLGLYIYAGEDLPEEGLKKASEREEKLKQLVAFVNFAKMENSDVAAMINVNFNKKSSQELTNEELDELIDMVKKMGKL